MLKGHLLWLRHSPHPHELCNRTIANLSLNTVWSALWSPHSSEYSAVATRAQPDWVSAGCRHSNRWSASMALPSSPSLGGLGSCYSHFTDKKIRAESSLTCLSMYSPEAAQEFQSTQVWPQSPKHCDPLSKTLLQCYNPPQGLLVSPGLSVISEGDVE